MRSRQRPAVAVAGLMLVLLGAAACGGEGEAEQQPPAVCADAEALESSVANLADITLNAGALADFQANLDEVKADLGQFKEDAQDQYSAELSALEEAANELSSSVSAAIVSPSISSIAEIGTHLGALGSALSRLRGAVQGTC